MEIIIGPRQSGKTKALIEQSHADNFKSWIVVPTQREAERVFSMAKDMEAIIPFPITIDEAMRGEIGHGVKAVHIDNIDCIIRMLIRGKNIKSVSMTVGDYNSITIF